MRPIEFILTHTHAFTRNSRSSKSIDEMINQFITLSAHYMNLPAEQLVKLKQQQQSLTNEKLQESS